MMRNSNMKRTGTSRFLTVTKFRVVIFVQHLMLGLDLTVNSFAEYIGWKNVHFLILYVVQDVTLIFSLITIFLTFANTYIFQAGMIGVLTRQFRTPIVVVGSYIILSVAHHVTTLKARWDANPGEHFWSPGFVATFVIHRVGAVFYYHFYRRTALRMADPVFYDPEHWMKLDLTKTSAHDGGRRRKRKSRRENTKPIEMAPRDALETA